MTKIFNIIDKDGDNFISIKDLHNFTCKTVPLDACHSIMKECLFLIDFCSNKEPPSNNIAESNELPSEMMRLSFSQFKNIVLNQGFVIRDESKKNIAN